MNEIHPLEPIPNPLLDQRDFVVPAALEDQVLQLAAEKVGKESDSRRELLKGRTLRDVYEEYGVL